MIYTVKSGLTTSNGSNFGRQDISPVISLTSTRPRPISQRAPRVKATNQVHYWVEQARNTAFTGGTSFAEGGTPSANALAPTRPSNQTCRLGALAQVTDTMRAVFNGGGTWKLDDGEMERLENEALDLQVSLATLDVLDDIEGMHAVGDHTVAGAWANGGQTDGLYKSAGTTMTSSVNAAFTGTSGTPVAFQEQFIKDIARVSAESYPAVLADTMLVPPELIPDINALIANGAARPVTVVVDPKDANGTANLVAGQSVGKYNTGYSIVDVKVEPHLSSAFNSQAVDQSIILYNSQQVKHAELIPLGVEELARTGAARQKMVTTEFAQEHRIAAHICLIPFLKSAQA